MRSAAIVVLAALLGVLTAGPAGARPDSTSTSPLEYQVKAAFLYRLTQFAEWSPEPDGDGPFVFGVVGSAPLERALRTAVVGKTRNGRRCVVRSVSGPRDLHGCRVLFVGASQARHLREWIEALGGTPVLVVGESDGFAAAGGAVGFFTDAGRLRFEINPGAASRAHVRLSSRLLDLAVIVRDARRR